MAPVCKACHLSLSTLCEFLLILSLVLVNVKSLLVYNRQMLLDLNISAKDPAQSDFNGHKTLPPFLSEIPAYLCHALVLLLQPKRRRDKYKGCLVWIKTAWCIFLCLQKMDLEWCLACQFLGTCWNPLVPSWYLLLPCRECFSLSLLSFSPSRTGWISRVSSHCVRLPGQLMWRIRWPLFGVAWLTLSHYRTKLSS